MMAALRSATLVKTPRRICAAPQERRLGLPIRGSRACDRLPDLVFYRYCRQACGAGGRSRARPWHRRGPRWASRGLESACAGLGGALIDSRPPSAALAQGDHHRPTRGLVLRNCLPGLRIAHDPSLKPERIRRHSKQGDAHLGQTQETSTWPPAPFPLGNRAPLFQRQDDGT